MKLTLVGRIVLAVAGLAIMLLLLFPPWVSYGGNRAGHMWITASETAYLNVDFATLILEIAAVFVGAVTLLAVTGKSPKPEPDKDA